MSVKVGIATALMVQRAEDAKCGWNQDVQPVTIPDLLIGELFSDQGL